MTFLEIVQRLHRLSGATGLEPISVVDQEAESQRLADWVSDADIDIQNQWLNWNFLRARTGSHFTLTPEAPTPPPSNLFSWDRVTFRIKEREGLSWQPISVFEYDEVKATMYLEASTGFPYQAIIMPDNTLEFISIPDRQYPFQASYYKKPARMTLSEHVSLIPEAYHTTSILGQALIYYAEYEDAPEMLRFANSLTKRGLGPLEAHELPSQGGERRMGAELVVIPE